MFSDCIAEISLQELQQRSIVRRALRPVTCIVAAVLSRCTHHIFSNFLEKGRRKSRNTLQWRKRRTLCGRCCGRGLSDRLVQSLLQRLRSRLVHVPQGRVRSHRKPLKRLAVGQSLNKHFVRQIIHQSLNELTAHNILSG